jgi:hypothetical protein
MSLAVERFDARAWADSDLERLFEGAFPAFITADQVAKSFIGRVREWFAELNIVVIEDGRIPVATGWAVPIRWDGSLADLPTGYTGTLRRAVEGREADQQPDTLVICGAIVHPGRIGQSLAAYLLTALRGLAPQAGCQRILAPVRPTLKPAYPLIPIETFAHWTRPDGAPLDPWLRTHWRLGGTIIATAPRSQTMTGTVAEWESWTGMALPATGDYVIPRGLSILRIDAREDRGSYTEPNVWVRHR